MKANQTNRGHEQSAALFDIYRCLSNNTNALVENDEYNSLNE